MFKALCLMVFLISFTTSYTFQNNLRFNGGLQLTPYSVAFETFKPDLEALVNSFTLNEGIIVTSMDELVNKVIHHMNGDVMTIRKSFNGQIVIADTPDVRRELTGYFEDECAGGS